MFSKVLILGELAGEPVLMYTSSGRAMTKLVIQVTSLIENTQGEPVEQKSWIHIIAWDELAECCNEYLRKDMTVFIEGNLQIRSFRVENGYRRRTVDIVVKHIEPVAEEHICQHFQDTTID